MLLVARAGAARRRALQGAAVAILLAGAPFAIYILLNRFAWNRGFFPGGIGTTSAAPYVGRHFSTTEELSHAWQLFLPHLWLHPQFSVYPLWPVWFVGFFGRFGWQDYTFPYWLYQVARVVRDRRARYSPRASAGAGGRSLRRRWGELAVYGAAVAGLCAVIGIEAYRYFLSTGLEFAQARYLLPLLGLYGAIGALAVRAGGRRWGPALAAGLVDPCDRPRPLRAGDHRRPLLLVSEVSVAIPVRNGGPALEGVLAALAAPDGRPRADRVRLGLHRRLGAAGPRAWGARARDPARRSFNHGATRNLLMERAGGSRVAFLTQDAEPADERWLERLLERPRPGARRGHRLRALPAPAGRVGGGADRARALVRLALARRAPAGGAPGERTSAPRCP